jgi:hypothetical protein
MFGAGGRPASLFDANRHGICDAASDWGPEEDEMPRFKSTEQPPMGRHVLIQRRGELYHGSYSVDGLMVVVDSPMLGTKRAWLGELTAEARAKILLTELLEEQDKRNAVNDDDYT